MNAQVWLITAKSNLHIGNENTSNYGLIDKSIQKDVLTGLPNINGSSLKGSINEFFTVKKKKSEEFLKNVFGADKRAKTNNTQKGNVAFFDAHLLSIPVQSNNRLFYRATSPTLLTAFIKQLDLFGIKIETFNFENIMPTDGAPIVFTEDNTILNDFNAIKKERTTETNQLETLLGENIALFSEKDFKELCDDDNLPIIARNKLENGESKNLWYEQVLPQETLFYFITLCNNESEINELNGELVQIGANATIGYGYCMFKQFNS